MLMPILLPAIAVALVLCFILLRGSGKPTHAGGIVYRKDGDGTLFLIVSSLSVKDKWVFPKGHIDKGEKPTSAAMREVLEESGVRAKVVKKAGITNYTKKGKKYCAVYFIMKFVDVNGEGSENREVLWLTKDEALEKLGAARSARLLRRFSE